MFNFKITRTMKKTLSLIIALALLMGAKAFAQELEWEWRGLTTNDEFYEINTPYETSDGRILVTGRTGYLEDCYSFNRWYKPTPTLMSLSSDGEELFQRQYHKDGYFTYVPYVLENSSGEVFLFITYSPHHDTCSPNYYRNFDPPTDHSILGLYKLNDDLSIAESHELEICMNITMTSMEAETTRPLSGMLIGSQRGIVWIGLSIGRVSKCWATARFIMPIHCTKTGFKEETRGS